MLVGYPVLRKAKDMSPGMNAQAIGWLEAGTSGFRENGRYYIQTMIGGRFALQRLSIQQGLLRSVDNHVPFCRLIPAIITIENGLHVSVVADSSGAGIIVPAVTSSRERGFVHRDALHLGSDPDGHRMDMFYPEESQADGWESKVKLAPQLFISYSHDDEALCDKLRIALQPLVRNKVIRAWYDRCITAGEDLDPEIEEQLRASAVILLLVSVDFLASDYCMSTEIKLAMELQQRGTLRVVPIILRPCEWKGEEFARFCALPKDACPVTKWENYDDAFLDVLQGIKKVINEISAQQKG